MNKTNIFKDKDQKNFEKKYKLLNPFVFLTVSIAVLMVLFKIFTSFYDAQRENGLNRNRTLISKNPYCIAAHLDYSDLSSSDREERMDLLRDSGASWVRFDFEAFRFTKNGKADFSYFDPIIEGLKKRGIGVIAILPQWGESRGEDYKKIIDSSTRYGEYASVLAKYLKSSEIKFAIEVGNEPNDDGFWPGRDPNVYTEYLISAYDAVKKVDENITVISGGVVMYFNDFKNLEFNALNWLKSLYKSGIKSEDNSHEGREILHFDIYAIHAYPGNNNVDRYIKIFNDAKKYINKEGDSAGIAITEIGWPTGSDGDRENVSLEIQKDKITNAFKKIAESELRPEVVCYYNLENKGEGKGIEENYGLLFNDLTPKPAFDAFREMTGDF